MRIVNKPLTLPLSDKFQGFIGKIRAGGGSFSDDAADFAELLADSGTRKNEAGIARLTHPNLRNFFATECIEAGVPVPTVALWLGHHDGGALCMRRYVTPRVGAGREAAARVNFGQRR